MKKITVAIFTTSRSEFGILLPFINAIGRDPELEYSLFAGGSHFAPEYGSTINEIIDSKVTITATFDYLLNEDSPRSLVRSLGIATFELAEIFNRFPFDWVCFLGDRFELLSIASASILFNKPMIHISGGEHTEGVLDNQVRHMLTKASHLHFTYTNEYVRNIIKMGEESWRVFNIGALGVDNLVHYPNVTKDKLFDTLELNAGKPTVLMTYHPVSLEKSVSVTDQIKNIFEALIPYDFQLVITSPNAEENRDTIVNFILTMVEKFPDFHFFKSLGEQNYNNLMPYCEFIIGNSSSGIAFAPYFKIPTINIGNRQKGRIRHLSIIDTDYSVKRIKEAIEQVTSKAFKEKVQLMEYKFGGGKSAELMVELIKRTPIDDTLLIKKSTF